MDGTLLGAYENNKMIPHDYDIDFAIYCTKDELCELHGFLQSALIKCNENYKCTYQDDWQCTKIRIVDIR